MIEEEVKEVALRLAKKWYKEEYGGYHYMTADEIVYDFLVWLLSKSP